MKFQRLYTKDSPAFSWKFTDSIIKDADGNVIFEAKNIEVPSHWSETAVNILAQKYFRRTGVPAVTVSRETVQNMPSWLWPRKAAALSSLQGETSAREVFHRLAGCWTYWGWKMGLFQTNEEDANSFYDEIYYMLFHQIAAPNSPQWFNTGLNWAYGITDYAEGYWRVDDTGEVTGTKGEVYEVKDRYLNPQPHACFIQPVADNLTDQGGIFDLLTKEAKLFKQGSGTGTNFSALRSKGEPLAGGGRSSGLMSFLRIFDRAADSVKSGGITRRAAKMVVLDLDHPEIEDFINWKVKEEHKAACLNVGSSYIQKSYQGHDNYMVRVEIPNAIIDRIENNFDLSTYELGWEDEAISTVSGQNSNNSVRVTNMFMDLVDDSDSNEGYKAWTLRRRTDGEATKFLDAKDLWRQICRAAWACGDPGVQFHDTMNMWNTCVNDGRINSTNPCSEYVFLDNTACNLASINLGKFGSGADFDIEAFQHATRVWTCILDISVTMASYPSKEIALGSHNFRTLGLGYANLAHLLHEEGLKYDSDAGRNRAAHLTALLHFTAYKTSCELAFYLGAFPRWENNKSSMESVLHQHNNAARDRGYTLLLSPTAAYRNAQVTLIAPTGTIALLMDCETTGVEPYYAPRVTKNLAGGGLFNFDNDIPASECAVGEGCLAPEAHVKMVAAIQPFLSGGVSKTVNLPNSATIDDVDKIYRLAHKLGLKSISLYRDGSKLTQPLETKKEEKVQKEEKPIGYGMFQVPKEYGVFKEVTNLRPHAARSSLPNKRGGYTRKFKINGQTAYLRTGEYEDGKLGEIFVNLAKEGSTARALMDAFSKAISIGLQYGVPLDEFVDAFKGARFEPSGFVQGHETIKQTASIIDFIFRELEETYLVQKEPLQRELFQQDIKYVASAEPSHVSRNSGEFCACGHEMLRTGTCLTCPNCGANTGCG